VLHLNAMRLFGLDRAEAAGADALRPFGAADEAGAPVAADAPAMGHLTPDE
jgi:hypothetical protein